MSIDWQSWSPASQEKLLDTLRDVEQDTWRPFYCPRQGCDGNHHITAPPCEAARLHDWEDVDGRWVCRACAVEGEAEDLWLFRHARADQHPPPGIDWLAWLLLAGRGAGKTRAGSEWTHRLARKEPGVRIALISPTGPDLRDTIVEGESGILATSRPGEVPIWEPSKKKLTWPNGSTAYGYSGEEPDRLRGKQHHYGWVDEPAHMPAIEDVWYNFLFGLRLGKHPKACLTTSPLPSKWLRELMEEQTTVVSRASTYSNLHNLPPHHAKVILKRYENTRLGRQEIMGEILEDVDGALWGNDLIENQRVAEAPDLDRIVVGVDPAGTKTRRSDETGIVVVGVKGEHFYVLADYSGKYSPAEWAEKVLWAHDLWKADAVVVEKTYGKDMVSMTIDSVMEKTKRNARIISVDSRRGKELRAEPVVAFYEKARVHHVGVLDTLEDQQTSWIPGKGSSPDRVDALVHAITELAQVAAPAEIAPPFRLLRRRRTGRYNPLEGISA